MTPEQELKVIWPKLNNSWPFPTQKPEEGAKREKPPVPAMTAISTTSTESLLAGSNGTSHSTIPVPQGWGTVAITGSTLNNTTLNGKKDSTIAVLDERAKNYGKFMDMAQITQSFKDILHTAPSWKTMQADQQESLEMIVHKIARILNGRPDYADSWVDIAGYARLVGDRLEKGIIR
jgi:hypothetical protein